MYIYIYIYICSYIVYIYIYIKSCIMMYIIIHIYIYIYTYICIYTNFIWVRHILFISPLIPKYLRAPPAFAPSIKVAILLEQRHGIFCAELPLDLAPGGCGCFCIEGAGLVVPGAAREIREVQKKGPASFRVFGLIQWFMGSRITEYDFSWF